MYNLPADLYVKIDMLMILNFVSFEKDHGTAQYTHNEKEKEKELNSLGVLPLDKNRIRTTEAKETE